VEARPDLVKRGDFGASLLSLLTRVLASVEKRGSGSSLTTGASDLETPRERESEEMHGWEMGYHVLVSVQAMYERLPGVVEAFWTTDSGKEMLRHVSALLVYRHAWVRLASCRLMGHYLDRRNPSSLSLRHADEAVGESGEEEFLCAPEVWFPLVRRLCVQLDRPSLASELSQRAVKSLLFVALALAQTPRVAATAKETANGQEEEDDEEEEEAEEEEEEEDEEEGGKGGKGSIPKNGLSWVMGRLAYMARRKGESHIYIEQKWHTGRRALTDRSCHLSSCRSIRFHLVVSPHHPVSHFSVMMQARTVVRRYSTSSRPSPAWPPRPSCCATCRTCSRHSTGPPPTDKVSHRTNPPLLHLLMR
jgi:hypothetical protein